jgi:hypothetical protein
MKKLKLNLQQFEGAEVLTRSQLKRFWVAVEIVMAVVVVVEHVHITIQMAAPLAGQS